MYHLNNLDLPKYQGANKRMAWTATKNRQKKHHI